MRTIKLVCAFITILLIGCSSPVEEDNLSDQALKNAQSKFETSATSEAQGGSSSKTSSTEVGEK